MRSRIPAVVLPSELGDLADEVRRVFLELGPSCGTGALAGKCSLSLDVYEHQIPIDPPESSPAA